MLRQREAAMKLKPVDANSATHLIRCALGGRLSSRIVGDGGRLA